METPPLRKLQLLQQHLLVCTGVMVQDVCSALMVFITVCFMSLFLLYVVAPATNKGKKVAAKDKKATSSKKAQVQILTLCVLNCTDLFSHPYMVIGNHIL